MNCIFFPISPPTEQWARKTLHCIATACLCFGRKFPQCRVASHSRRTRCRPPGVSLATRWLTITCHQVARVLDHTPPGESHQTRCCPPVCFYQMVSTMEGNTLLLGGLVSTGKIHSPKRSYSWVANLDGLPGQIDLAQLGVYPNRFTSIVGWTPPHLWPCYECFIKYQARSVGNAYDRHQRQESGCWWDRRWEEWQTVIWLWRWLSLCRWSANKKWRSTSGHLLTS